MARVVVYRSKQLTEKLRKLRQDTQVPVRAALAAGADEITAMQKRLAPDGPGTGEFDMKGTIKWRFGAEEGGGTDAKTGRSNSTAVVITAGDQKNPEARWLEFGTAPHENAGKFMGSDNPGISPQPFFFPSYRASKKAVARMIKTAIRKAIQDVARL